MKFRSSAFLLPVLSLMLSGVHADVQLIPVELPPPSILPYTPVVPPNPAIGTATLGIFPTQPNISPTQGAALARFAKNQYLKARKWKTIVIVVSNDHAALRQFGDYQAKRRGQPLGRADYKNLTSFWRKAICYYEYQDQGRSERIYFPSKNPAGWWQKWK